MRTERRPQAGSPASTPPAERDVVDLVVGDALAAFATRRARDTGRTEGAAPASPPSPSEEIGDIDLVDAVLAGGGRLPALAVAVASRESGIADLRLEPAEEAEGDHTQRTASVEVRHGEIPLGRLVSAQAGIEELRPWADWLAHWLHLDGEHQQLAQLAWLDELTGAGNRRAFERRLDEAIASARRERRPVTLMYFDVDDLKLYNDRFGHDAGDAVLSEVVELLQAVIRRGDQVFRVGGDEFVVIFSDSRGSRSIATPGLGIESVSTIAHRFRERVSELRLHQLGLDTPGTVSISAGLATYPWDGYDARSLLAHADQLALQSKRSGKNKISFGPGAKDHCAGA